MAASARSEATRISVGGGKGGTGKSLVALNLAVALAQHGLRVVLVDADLGAANLHTLLGIDRVGNTLLALLDREIDSLEEACIATAQPRLFLVPGIGAVVGAANLDHARKQKLLRHIAKLDADFVIVDVGAGVSFNMLDLFDTGHVRLVVTTPELTAVQNAYAFCKGAAHRALRAIAKTAEERSILERATVPSMTTERMRDVLARIDVCSADLGARARTVLATFGAGLVANQVEPGAPPNIAFAMTRLVRDFLELELPMLAQLPHDVGVHRSVARRVPHLLRAGRDDPFARGIATLAERILTMDLAELRCARAAATVPESDAAAQASGREPAPSIEAYVRREARTEVDLPAMLLTRSGPCPARLVDLSPRGACALALEAPLRVGETVRIALEVPLRAQLAGVVRHVEGRRIGVELAGESVLRAREVLGALAARTARIDAGHAMIADCG